MHSIYSSLVFRTTLFVFGATAAILASNADEPLKYRFASGYFTVDYGDVTEMSESDGRSFLLENDLSEVQPGAQITIGNIEGGCYLSFDWVSENEASPSDYSYLRISPHTPNMTTYEHTFHYPSMEEDRGTFRRYLPEGELYTVSVGAHVSDSNSDAYDLEIHNLKIERIDHPGTGLVPEIDTYLFVAPDREPTGEGTDSTPDPVTLPGDTPTIPDTTPVGEGTDSTPDPITLPGDTPTIPDTTPVGGGTDSTPDPITQPGDAPTIPDTTPVGRGTDSTPDPITFPRDTPNIPGTTPVGGGTDFTPDPVTLPGGTPTIPGTTPVGGGSDSIPDPITLPGDTPMYPDYTPTDTGTGPIFTNLPGYSPDGPGSGPGMTIPGVPITTSLPTTTGPSSGTGPAPTLPAFTPNPFSPSSGTGNGLTGKPETHSVPDSSLGFLGIATLLGLLFTKALMPKSTSRK